MEESKNRFLISKIWRYALFVFAFVCCAIVFSTSKVSAKWEPTISIPDSQITRDANGKVTQVKVYVGWDSIGVNEVYINLNNNWDKTVSGSPVTNTSDSNFSINVYGSKESSSICSSAGITCNTNIAVYTIKNLVGKGLVVTGNKFEVSVKADNSKLLGTIGGITETSKAITYDNAAPKVSRVALSKKGAGSGGLLKAKDSIQFYVELTESSTISSGVKVNFKLNNKSKSTTSCTTGSKASSFYCYYTIASGDGGNLDASRKITFISISGANNIKDTNGNAMADSVTSGTFEDTYNVMIDGVNPVVSKIESFDGVYSSSSKIEVKVTFSEKLSLSSSYAYPILKVKYGGGSEKACSQSGTVDNIAILYLCQPTVNDQGALTFVSLTGGAGFKDSAGNFISLPYSTAKTFDKVIVDNDVPGVIAVNFETKGCAQNDGSYYCSESDQIKIYFKFSMDVKIKSRTVNIKFNGVNGKNALSINTYDTTTKTLEVVYNINNQDNGEMVLEYNFSLEGANDKTNNVSNTKDGLGIYADNVSPLVGGIDVYVGEDKVSGNNLYIKPNDRVVFKVLINESSKITLDATKVSLVDLYGGRIPTDPNGIYGLTEMGVVLVDKTILIEIAIAGECSFSFKIKLLKDAVKDFSKEDLGSDYLSSEYSIDTSSPDVDVEVSYPEYSSYTRNGNTVLINGDSIDLKLISDDQDLKDYCVVENQDYDCAQYLDVTSEMISYDFNGLIEGDHILYVRIRDVAMNVSEYLVSFSYKEIFAYVNGAGSSANAHQVIVDTTMFNNGDVLKYIWVNKGATVSLTNATTIVKESDQIEVNGRDLNGEYRLCVSSVSTGEILCGEHVVFDSRIDNFEVTVSSSWTNQNIAPRIVYNDASVIKCIAVSKNYSNVNCETINNNNIIIYRTNQLSSPFELYQIEENGIYYFYIEDIAGNSKVVSKAIDKIDKDPINIEVFNGTTGEFNTNLEINSYKDEHSLLFTFDRNVGVGSAHSLYKYFFSTQKYENVTSREIYEAYYLINSYRNQVGVSNKTMSVTTPSVDGIHNLYVMAVDVAGNVSFKIINDILVDATGPEIKMYDSNGYETNGGSSNYLAVFDYSIAIEDEGSRLNLNKINYRWIDGQNNVVLEKEYKGCNFGESVCVIQGNNIAFEANVFKPTEKYRLVLTAYDNASNHSIFYSNEFMIDTTPPGIAIDVDEDAWYENGNISFRVSKENAGTLNIISYCLNDCFKEGNLYDLDKFTVVNASSTTSIEKSVSLSLESRINVFVVYANDIFGNYIYEQVNIKYDKENVEITVNDVDENDVIDLSSTSEENLKISFAIKDEVSGVDQYCIYYNNDASNKDCFDGENRKEIISQYGISKNGLYSIEAVDVVGNKTIYNVSVVGIDTEPVEFDLTSNVVSGSYASGDVVISIVNMRKYMVDDVGERISTIDYVILEIGTNLDDYESVFSTNTYVSIYNKASSGSLVTSFVVNDNKLYVVRIVDTAGNVSYRHILVNYIDTVRPILDGAGVSVSVSGIGKAYNDVTNGVYRYSSNFINLVFAQASMMDNNEYLGIRICFEESATCVYNTYNSTSYKSGLYYVNNSLTIAAPYNFSGIIRYYLVDGAGNENSTHQAITVNHQREVSDIAIIVEDAEGNLIDENSKYNLINVSLDGDEVLDIITSGLSGAGISYSLVKSNVNLYNIFANGGNLTSYGFVSLVDEANFEVKKTSVDGSYYLWIYVSDLLGNVKLMRSDCIIRMDTIAPNFDEINFNIEKVGTTEYKLTLNDFVDGYELFVDSDNNGIYETLEFEENEVLLNISGVDTISFELKDEAGNASYLRNVDVNSLTGVPFARVYQESNERIATVIVYNLGSKRVTNLRYIATSTTDVTQYQENSIAEIVYSCSETNFTETCKGTISGSGNVFTLDLSSLGVDKRVIFYVYVDGALINLIEKNVVQDKVAPFVTIKEGNETITTVGKNTYSYEIEVVEDNLSILTGKKYILSKNAVNVYDFETRYQSCVGSDSCARGTYELNSSLKGTIEIGNNFKHLSSGRYNLYIYLEDDFKNSKFINKEIYIDNEAPKVKYSIANNPNQYIEINDVVYVGGAAKLMITDNNGVSHFNIYVKGSDDPLTVCYIDGNGSNVNCSNLIDSIYYNLDTGNYIVNVYDLVGNVREIVINVDGSDPIIKVYKKVGQSYEAQNVSGKLYNDLKDLYLVVEEANFSHITLDLINTSTGVSITSAARYSANSQVGTCLIDREACLNGVSLISLIVGNVSQYNKIRINAYDNAFRYSYSEINYDDNVPEIWMVNVGETVYVGGMAYTVEDGMTINVEIGVNKQLTLDSLLNKIILSVEGVSYNEIKNSELFSVKVYKDSKVFDGELSAYIGNYKVELNYVDGAGNRAPTKELNINVMDNTKPQIEAVSDISNVEIKESVVIEGAISTDNYGLVMIDNQLVKEQYLALSSASCKFEVEEITKTCTNEVIIEDENTYKFVKSGKYIFTYVVTDLAGNEQTFDQVIVVSDTKGPQMSSSENGNTTFEIYFGNRISGALNIENMVLRYPNSYDVGDDENKAVTYVGLFALNNMAEKYKVDDKYLVGDANNALTYSFKKVGTYYLRFTSLDANNNISLFEYEVIVKDVISPVLSGVSDKQVIKLGLDEDFSVEYLINKYSITASDNYDDNVKIYYELKQTNNHSHEVVLKCRDSSDNQISITVFVDIEDYVAPTVGDLVLDSSTNKNKVEFMILGGGDNSNNWWHEYSINADGKWIRIGENTVLEFNDGVSEHVNVCIRAVDGSNNISGAQSCRTILVDTKAPTISGVKDGAISSTEVTITVSDDRLSSVSAWFNDELLELALKDLPFKFTSIGSYQVVARDTLGNERVVSFMINMETQMDIVNDINSPEYTINSIQFDERFLVRVDITYDNNGYSNIYTKLDDIKIDADDMLYILGVIPNTNNGFVVFSVNGVNIKNYVNGVNLIGSGNTFMQGVDNEDCFVKFNDCYYAYVLIKDNASKGPVAVVDDNKEEKDNSKLLGGLIIVLGLAGVALGGYLIIRFKKRVRAA